MRWLTQQGCCITRDTPALWHRPCNSQDLRKLHGCNSREDCLRETLRAGACSCLELLPAAGVKGPLAVEEAEAGVPPLCLHV